MFRLLLVVSILVLAACEKKAETPKETPKEESKEAVKEAPKEEPKEEPKEDASGTWVPMDAYGVKFRVPDDWNVKSDAGSASATSPDGTTTALLVGSESENVVQSAIENIKKKIKFEDVDIKRTDLTTVNGLPGYAASGTAVLVKDDGKQEIQFLMNAVKIGDQAAALLIFAEAEMYEAKKEEIDGLAKTLAKK